MTTSGGHIDDQPREDHAGADALVGETLLEQLGETFCHTFTSRDADAAHVAELDIPRARQSDEHRPRHPGEAATRKTLRVEPELHNARARPNASTRSTTCVDRKTGRVDHLCIGRRLQRARRTGRIPQVPLGDLARKGGKANTRPLVFQLLMAPQRPLFGAGGQEDLEVGAGKYHGAHVPPVGDQARRPGEGVLAGQQRRAHLGPGRHPRGALPAGFRAHLAP